MQLEDFEDHVHEALTGEMGLGYDTATNVLRETVVETIVVEEYNVMWAEGFYDPVYVAERIIEHVG